MEKSSENKIDINQFTNLLSGKSSTYVPERYRNGKQNNGWNFIDKIMKSLLQWISKKKFTR